MKKGVGKQTTYEFFKSCSIRLNLNGMHRHYAAVLFSFMLLIRLNYAAVLSTREFAEEHGRNVVVMNSGPGWTIAKVYGEVPVFQVEQDAYDMSRFIVNGGGENLPVATHDCSLNNSSMSSTEDIIRFMMLKVIIDVFYVFVFILL